MIETGVPGPTVLIVGGIHGNEPAGFRAADQVRHWPINRGKLIVIPKLNRLGVEANIRWSPDHRNDREGAGSEPKFWNSRTTKAANGSLPGDLEIY